MKKMAFLLAGVLVCGMFAAVPEAVAAENTAQTIKANMQKRLPAINALLKRGVIGEGNNGCLAVLGTLTEDERKMVEAENQDRQTVYKAIARQQGQGVTPEQVGQRRALQIAERAPAGTRIQNAEGKWQTK